MERPGMDDAQAAGLGASSRGETAGAVGEVFRTALGLGLTSFGGPIAHIGYFRREYVERRRWLDEAAFADLVALCQFLPGPASSQLGIAIGTRRAGLLGGLAAWLGFTLPSAVLLLLFGLYVGGVDLAGAGWVHGLKLAALAVVAQAIWSMARSLTPDPARRAMALAAAVGALIWTSTFAQVGLIAIGAMVGRLVLPPLHGTMAGPGWRTVPRGLAIASLGLFLGLLVGLPLLVGGGRGVQALFAAFYGSGALVFGGGHVVLPLLHTAVVEPGWVTDDQFLAGYGAAQAVPGPLFTIAAFLGTVAVPVAPSLGGPLNGLGPGVPTSPAGLVGAVVAVVGIFLPGYLLIVGTLPFWDRLRRSPGFRRALAGTNAVVVGLLVAAFWNPIWVGSVRGPVDVLIAGAGLGLLATRRVPPIVVVALAAAAGQLISSA